MRAWLSRIWNGKGRDKPASAKAVTRPRDEDAELAELTALIESGDTGEAALERMAELLGQTDPNKNRF
jgi:hypothetical protein